nr:hypothetical protein Itr_chr08CG19290 [Ipomoea trifida]GMD28481.1 hypothetical protein Iba_chr08eCG7780 [Ipomoea batatas]
MKGKGSKHLRTLLDNLLVDERGGLVLPTATTLTPSARRPDLSAAKRTRWSTAGSAMAAAFSKSGATCNF